MDVRFYFHPDAPKGTLPQAARAGDFVFFAGGMAYHPTKGVPDEIKPAKGFPYHGNGGDRQARYIFKNMAAVLEEAGSSIKHIMKNNAFHTNPAEIDGAIQVRRDFFNLDSPPPSTLVIVPETHVRGATVINDCVALATDARLDRVSHLKSTDNVPLPAIGIIYGRPIYVQFVRGGGLVFTQGKGASRGGQLAAELFGHADFPYRDNQIRIQTEIVMDYFKSLLADEDVSLEHVVKAELFMSHTSQVAGMDEAWRKYFPKDPPARTVLPTILATDPVAAIEIELVAVDPSGPYRKEVIHTDKAPLPIGHEAQAMRAGPYLFISGQMATDYKHGLAPEARPNTAFPFHSSGIKKQVNFILDNVEAICLAAGTSSLNLVRRRAMHTNLADLPEAEEVWRERLGDRVPPTTIFRPADVLPVPDCTVQYDLTAFIPHAY